MAGLDWLGTQRMFLLDGHRPYWAASGVRGEQALDEVRAQPSGIHVLHCSYREQPACWSPLPICTLCLLDRYPACLPLGCL